MSKPVESHQPVANRLLAALPPEEYSSILPRLELVHLTRGKVLYEIDETVLHAYFPLNGLISLFSLTEDGATIESALVGNEGVVGLPVFLKHHKTPYQIVVQFPSDALRIKAAVLEREFSRCGPLQDLLLRYTQAVLAQISQAATCNHFHSVKERLCRWLLMSRDRTTADVLQLTQESLSKILGAPRTGVSSAIGELQREGVIRATRGRIQILDRKGLESSACKCYDAAREGIEDLFSD